LSDALFVKRVERLLFEVYSYISRKRRRAIKVKGSRSR